MIKLLTFICLLFSLVGMNSFAQDIKKTRDMGFWVSSTIEVNLTKRYKLSFSQDLRLFENSKKLEKYISDLGIDYKINKEFSLGANGRFFLNRKNDNTLSQDYRYNLDFKFKKKFKKKFKFKYRLRFQSTYEEPFGLGMNKGGLKSNLRNYIGVDYKLNKINVLFLNFELFREIVAYRKPYFHKFRLSLGDEVKTKIGKIGLSINFERELNSNYPLNFLFFRINHCFKLKK